MVGRAGGEATPGTTDLLHGAFTEAHRDTGGRRKAASHAHGGLTEGRVDVRGSGLAGLSTRLWWWRRREWSLDWRRWRQG